MILSIILLFLCYFLLLIVLIVGWKWAMGKRENATASLPRITLVIPFRNEAHVIDNIIQDIHQLDYPDSQLEVILVNDHSEDESVRRVMLHAGMQGWRIHHLPLNETGKKRALTQGISLATGEVIVTTDADCRLQPQWLSQLVKSFDVHTVMVIGAVRLSDDQGFFSKLQALEFASLTGVAGSSAGLVHPVLCNGANLAFTKAAFLAVNGYEGNLQVASGDDEFLMRKMLVHFPGKVKFVANPLVVVTAAPAIGLNQFIQQRLRWAGKWKHNTDLRARALAVWIWVVQLTWFALPVMWLTDWIPSTLLVQVAVFKCILEGLFFYQVTKFLGQPLRLFYFILLQCIYAPYVVMIGFLGPWVKHQWKGRS